MVRSGRLGPSRSFSNRRWANLDVFVHIPKSAGTSIRSMLAELFPKRLLHVAGGMHDMAGLGTALRDAEICGDSIIFGHLPYGILPTNGVNYATVLRDPIDRAVSAFHYARERPLNYANREAHELGFRGFLEARASRFLDNQQVRYVAGVAESRAVTVGDLDTAKRNVAESFGYVGLYEELQAFTCRYVASFGASWNDEVPRIKPTIARPGLDAVPEDWKLQVETTFWADVALYEFARPILTAPLESRVEDVAASMFVRAPNNERSGKDG